MYSELSPEMLVTTYRITIRQNPDDYSLYLYDRENITFSKDLVSISNLARILDLRTEILKLWHAPELACREKNAYNNFVIIVHIRLFSNDH